MFSFVDSNRPSYRLSSSIGGVCGEIHRTTQPITTHQRGKTRPKRPGIGEARANFSHNWTGVLSFAATRVLPSLRASFQSLSDAWKRRKWPGLSWRMCEMLLFPLFVATRFMHSYSTIAGLAVFRIVSGVSHLERVMDAGSTCLVRCLNRLNGLLRCMRVAA